MAQHSDSSGWILSKAYSSLKFSFRVFRVFCGLSRIAGLPSTFKSGKFDLLVTLTLQLKEREVMPLLVVGSVALDSVQTPMDSRENVLGGSAVFFSYAASYFTPVQLVSVVGEDWPPEHTALLRQRAR